MKGTTVMPRDPLFMQQYIFPRYYIILPLILMLILITEHIT